MAGSRAEHGCGAGPGATTDRRDGPRDHPFRPPSRTPPPANRRQDPPTLKVVFLCQRVPYPPDRGDRITTWHFLQHLLAQGNALRVGCLAEEDRDATGVSELRARGCVVEAPRIDRRLRRLASLRGLLTAEALTLPFFRVAALRARVERWLRDDPPDLIYVYSSGMAQYARAEGPWARVMHFAELDSDKWRQFAAAARSPLARWVYAREARRLLAFERAVARAFDASVVVSEVERALFVERIPGVVPHVLRNGVDVERFASRGDATREPHTAVFTGVMDYAPNVQGVLWFVQECWPALRAGFRDARLLVVGANPVAAIRALHGREGIEVTGRVPETQPYFDRACVAIAPLHLARGVQNKVLEALCMGLPVVVTAMAAQGIGTPPAGCVAIADEVDATTAAVRHWFADPPAAREAGARAAAWVREHFRWQQMYADLDRIVAAALDHRRGAAPRPAAGLSD